MMMIRRRRRRRRRRSRREKKGYVTILQPEGEPTRIQIHANVSE